MRDSISYMKEISGDISATYRLSKGKILQYLFFNFFRGVAGYFTFFRTKFWSPKKINYQHSSPGRQYLDAFLVEMFPVFYKQRQVSVLDIGCGSGYLRSVFVQAGYAGEYIGLDIQKDRHFDDNSNISFVSNFVQSRIEDFSSAEKFNMVISNTTLEHIKNDALAVKKSKELVKKGGVQIHIVPAFWSLFLYLLHGYRQYNPRRIKKLFEGQDYEVFRLGGLFSFLLHFFWITIPERLTASDKLRRGTAYPHAVSIAHKLDKYIPVCSFFYIIVVRS